MQQAFALARLMFTRLTWPDVYMYLKWRKGIWLIRLSSGIGLQIPPNIQQCVSEWIQRMVDGRMSNNIVFVISKWPNFSSKWLPQDATGVRACACDVYTTWPSGNALGKHIPDQLPTYFLFLQLQKRACSLSCLLFNCLAASPLSHPPRYYLGAARAMR